MRPQIRLSIVATLALLASLLCLHQPATHAGASTPAAAAASAIAAAAVGYDTVLNVPAISGTAAAQRAIGKIIRDAETEPVGFLFSGDSRMTANGGAGRHLVESLGILMPSLTSHGNMPQTPALSLSPNTTEAWLCGLALNQSAYASSNTGRGCTSERAYPSLEPSPAAAPITDGSTSGTRRTGNHPTGAIFFRFDPEQRNVSVLRKSKGMTLWDRDNNIRFSWFAANNATMAAQAHVALQGKATYSGTVNDTGVTQIGTESPSLAALETAENGVTKFTTPATALDAYEMYQIRVTALDADGVEVGAGRAEQVDDAGNLVPGIWIQHSAAGGITTATLMEDHPDSGPWFTAFGPFRCIVMACNVNDNSIYTPAQWETVMRQGITDLRTLCGQPGLPAIIWIQAQSVHAPSEATFLGYFQEYAGVAKTIAESMDNVVAINTAREILERYHDPQINWVPGGTYQGDYAAGTAYAVGDVMRYPAGTGNPWYRCKTATSPGEHPGSHAAKWRVLEAAYNSATTYEYGDCVTHAGQHWGYVAIETIASGQEPGAHVNWVRCTPFKPSDRVHPIENGAELYAELFVKALRELAGYRRGYRSPGILPRRRREPGRPKRPHRGHGATVNA